MQLNLEIQGPGWYPLSEREERLFTNRSNRPEDDIKDELSNDGASIPWRLWSTAQNRLVQLRQPGPPTVFAGDEGVLPARYTQVREEEHVIPLQFDVLHLKSLNVSFNLSVDVLLVVVRATEFLSLCSSCCCFLVVASLLLFLVVVPCFFVPSRDSAFFAFCLDFVGTCGPLHVFAKT